MPYVNFLVFRGTDFFYKPPFARELRKLPNGSKGVQFRGKIYQIYEGKIDINKKSYKINDCPVVDAHHSLDPDNLDKSQFFYDDKIYNPILYFNGFEEDLDSFLLSLDYKKIDYLQGDLCKDKASNKKKYDYQIKFSDESIKENNLSINDILRILLYSRNDPVVDSIEKNINVILETSIEEGIKAKNILNLLERYPIHTLPNLILKLKNNKNTYEVNNNLVKNLKEEKIKLELKLQSKEEEIEVFDELLNKKASEEYKISKISEQSEYINELENTVNQLYDENHNLKKDKKNFLSTNLKKKFLNFISDICSSTMPRIRLILRSEITLFEKFDDLSIIFNLLNKINDKQNIKFRKIVHLDKWFEVNEHISTGKEKKGRIYFSPLKNNLVAVCIDYKFDDKSQKKIFNNLDNFNLSLIR